MAKDTKELEENKKEQVERVLMIEEALEKLTLPVIREAKTPIEAFGILSLYVQSMALAIILSNGMPVADNFNIMLKKIADRGGSLRFPLPACSGTPFLCRRRRGP